MKTVRAIPSVDKALGEDEDDAAIDSLVIRSGHCCLASAIRLNVTGPVWCARRRRTLSCASACLAVRAIPMTAHP